MKEFALMRKFLFMYVGISVVLIVLTRPPVQTLGIALVLGAVCGVLQILAARLGQKRLFQATFIGLVVLLGSFVYFEAPFFPYTGVGQVATLGMLAATVQRAVGAYGHKYALGGESVSVGGNS